MKARTYLVNVFAIVLAIPMSHAQSLPAAGLQDEEANLIVNGGFEENGGLGTNIFAGWTVYDESGGSGSWYAQKGVVPVPPRLACTNVMSVASPPAGFAAMSTQSGAGSHVLYQFVAIPESAGSAILSADVYYNSETQIVAPPSLSYKGGVNQQFRVDITDPAAPILDVGEGVLGSVFRTMDGDDYLSAGYFTVTYDLSAFRGKTIRLRFAQADNAGCFSAGVDNVSITTGSGCPIGAPRNISFSFLGQTSSCSISSSACVPGEAIAFTPAGGSYVFQTCDTYSWVFGDGGVSSSPSPSHSYSIPGVYPAHLTVSNAAGSSQSQTTAILVGEAPQRRRPVRR